MEIDPVSDERARLAAFYQQILINTLLTDLAKANLALKQAQQHLSPEPDGETP